MVRAFLALMRSGCLTAKDICPELPEEATGLPKVTEKSCVGASCSLCVQACPTQAIAVDRITGAVKLDRGRCIGCNLCVDVCPSHTLAPDRSTRTAVCSREDLVLTNHPTQTAAPPSARKIFRRSLHVRVVSTGCSATDLEVIAAFNPLFDSARFGISLVASPRFADALLVTGPVGRAMRDPLRRCYEAMAEPRLVIAAGTCAISGAIHNGGYAEADGVPAVLPVDVFIPGDPPHPWSLIHGLLLAMGRWRLASETFTSK